MLARVFSCAVIGLEGVIVEVQIDTTQGLPGMDIVGLPDAAVNESRQRVYSAIKNAALPYPRKRIVVNLAPAAVRKEGPAYDLPIALGVILISELIPLEAVEGALVIGELSLDGGVRHVRGLLPMAALAREQGFATSFCTARGRGRSRPDPGIGSDPGAFPGCPVRSFDRNPAHPAPSPCRS